MAHFTLLRASEGLWVGVVTQAEFWALDQGRFKSINGDDGGTWNPAAPIIIGGAGLQIAGGITFSGGGTITDPVIEGTLTANDDVVLGEDATDDVTVNGTTHFTSPVFFDDDVTIGDSSADDLVVNATSTYAGPVTFNGNFIMPSGGSGTAVIGRPTAIGVLTITGGFTAGNDAETGINIVLGGAADAVSIGGFMQTTETGVEFTGTVEMTAATISGAVEMADAVTLTTGHIRRRLVYIAASMNLTVAACDVAINRADSVADKTVDLLSTGAADGDMITIINESQTYLVYVENNGTEISGVRYSFASQDYAHSTYIYSAVDGGWRVLERYGSTNAT